MATTGVPTAAARCIGPLSLVMTTAAAAVKFGELGEIGLSGEIADSRAGAQPSNDVCDARRVGGGTGEHDAFARQVAESAPRTFRRPKVWLASARRD